MLRELGTQRAAPAAYRRDLLPITMFVVAGVLLLQSDPAAAQGMRGGWTASAGHLSRSIAHWIGILGGLVIIYFSIGVGRAMRGSLLARCSLLVAIATALFVLVFLDMETGHLQGAGLWSVSVPIEIAQLWWMTALAAMITLYTIGYRELTVRIGDTSSQGPSSNRFRLGAWTAATVAVFLLIGMAGSVDSGSPAITDTARSAAHLLGLGASLLLIYYSNRAGKRFEGGVYATTSVYALIGATVFAVAFAAMELQHGLGITVLSVVPGMQMKMAISMILFTSTVFAFGWAYYRLAKAVGAV